MNDSAGIIIGGGIGGLTAALALERHGITIRVYEAAPALHPIGAGIWMAPNAMAILERLGVADSVAEAGVALERLQLFDKSGTLLHSGLGRDLKAQFGHSIVSLRRAQLHQTLLDHLHADTVILGKRLKSVHQQGPSARVTFDDSTEANGPFVIGADGVDSRVREELFPNAELRYAGETCWRGLSTFALPAEFHLTSAECWGVRTRFGFGPVAATDVYWWATQKSEAGGKDSAGIKSRLLELYGDFMSPVPHLIEHTPEDQIVRHDLFDLPPLAAWGLGCVTLLGDAAHAPTPNLGQGGAQAIEDAWVVAQCLEPGAGNDVPTAFMKYAALRKRKADQIVRDSWRLGRLAGIERPALRAVRNLFLRWTPQFVSNRQMASMFRVDA